MYKNAILHISFISLRKFFPNFIKWIEGLLYVKHMLFHDFEDNNKDILWLWWGRNKVTWVDAFEEAAAVIIIVKFVKGWLRI